MGNSSEAVTNIRHIIESQDRTFAWLARQTGIPYKRILSEIKNEKRPISLDTALASSSVLGIELPELIGKAA